MRRWECFVRSFGRQIDRNTDRRRTHNTHFQTDKEKRWGQR